MKEEYGFLINGKWKFSKRKLNVFNPFNNKVISKISVVDKNNVLDAIDSSTKAFQV